MPRTPVLTPARALDALPDTLPLGEHARVHVSFGFADGHGRVMGCEITIHHAPAYAGTPYDPAAPERFKVYPHVTRDGARYGAINAKAYRKAHASYAEARAYAEEYVAGVRERAWRLVVRLAAERADREDGHVRASKA